MDPMMTLRSVLSCCQPNPFIFNLNPTMGLLTSWSLVTEFSHIE